MCKNLGKAFNNVYACPEKIPRSSCSTSVSCPTSFEVEQVIIDPFVCYANNLWRNPYYFDLNEIHGAPEIANNPSSLYPEWILS